jgi:hypothetical protein
MELLRNIIPKMKVITVNNAIFCFALAEFGERLKCGSEDGCARKRTMRLLMQETALNPNSS